MPYENSSSVILENAFGLGTAACHGCFRVLGGRIVLLVCLVWNTMISMRLSTLRSYAQLTWLAGLEAVG